MKKILFILIICFVSYGYAQRETTKGDFREPFKICFNNKTSKTVYVALRYKTVGGVWKTKYWIKYKPYEKDGNSNTYAVKTYNRYFYYYARTKSNSGRFKYWGASDHYRTVDGKKVGMREKYINRSDYPNPRGQKYCIGLSN